MRKKRSFVITYLASMTTGATIGLTRILVIFLFFLGGGKRSPLLCFGRTISLLSSVTRAVLNAGSNERGCC